MTGKQRQCVLDAVAVATGNAWVDWWRAELGQQGRAMMGGWPGTLSEARRRILAGTVSALGPEGMLSEHELAEHAHTVFAAARAAWMASAVREQE
jgi:hypothetical protein